MHLFSRTITLSGVSPESVALAADVRAIASEGIGVEIGLWAVGLGAPFGTMTYAAPVDGLAGSAAMNAKLVDHAGYIAAAAKLREHTTGPAETNMMMPIHGEIRSEGVPPLGAVATSTTAIAAGSYDKVVAFGVEVAQLVESVTGTPMVFGSSVAGQFGEFGWLGVSMDAAAADEANSKLLANPDYIALLSAGGEHFVQGSGHRMIATRIA